VSDLPLIDLKPATSISRAEVIAGLERPDKSIAPKFLYDARGSALFEQITRLPEYYLTRTELAILQHSAGEMAQRIGAGAALIEFGSGSSGKVRRLLEPLAPVAYLPVDISREALSRAADDIQRDYPWLRVVPICADYSRPFAMPTRLPQATHRAAFFPGSSIGNFEPHAAVRFLSHVAALVGPDGQLLIGIDLKKDRGVLERAYNDAQGVTAEFNLNVLNHLNEALGADFDLAAFVHRARYDETRGCIEIHLISRARQTVTIGGRRIELREGEAIHTENSYKYDPAEFDRLAGMAGFAMQQRWVDAKGWFALVLYRANRVTRVLGSA
jgi:dimethylhistidine N-methyltransferase